MAGKGGKTAGSWKPGQSGNPKGGRKNAPRSLHWHVKQRFSDEDRAKAIDAQIARARSGDEKSLELLAKLGGDAGESTTPTGNVNVLAILGADRELAQRVFAALAMGVRNAGGLGVVRESGGLDSLAAPDDGE